MRETRFGFTDASISAIVGYSFKKTRKHKRDILTLLRNEANSLKIVYVSKDAKKLCDSVGIKAQNYNVSTKKWPKIAKISQISKLTKCEHVIPINMIANQIFALKGNEKAIRTLISDFSNFEVALITTEEDKRINKIDKNVRLNWKATYQAGKVQLLDINDLIVNDTFQFGVIK
jgi:hypothetical protein